MPLLHAARSTAGGRLNVTFGRSTTVPSGEAILRISARTTGKPPSLPPRVSRAARERGTRRSARGAASAVLKPIIAATCAAIFRAANRPVLRARVNPPSRRRNLCKRRSSWRDSTGKLTRGCEKTWLRAAFALLFQTDSLFTVRKPRTELAILFRKGPLAHRAAVTHSRCESDSTADSLACRDRCRVRSVWRVSLISRRNSPFPPPADEISPKRVADEPRKTREISILFWNRPSFWVWERVFQPSAEMRRKRESLVTA